ncbi:hypothetical protein [Nannocystis bainbridge]|uniref:DUF2335 domain-containing protein n=1 Tax=Nannocystis bainbridge TaxID=2995303 RepID=A0ABT5E3X0_9BACT|nr:hypothetical protein [Nannocystis bainbridge]MDC0719431.1 hypothetical protein [Nannocystis bainbridge]
MSDPNKTSNEQALQHVGDEDSPEVLQPEEEGVHPALSEQQSALLLAVRDMVIQPLVRVTETDIAARREQGREELEFADRHLQRENALQLHRLYVTGTVILVLVIGALLLLFYDKETGLIILTMISIAGGAFSFGRTRQKD